MIAHYKVDEPRVTIAQLNHDTLEESARELGQGESMGEAMFFLALGYRVEISRWDGKKFCNEANYYPGDL
jgi:hypothetical protein